MHKYNKIRGILRARQGSQIPKLLGGNVFKYGSIKPEPISFTSLAQKSDFSELKKIPIAPDQTNIFLRNIKDNIGNIGKNIGQDIKDSIANIGQNAIVSGVGMGIDMLGNQFNDTEDSKGIDNMFALGNAASSLVGQINPAAGLAVKAFNTGLQGLNSLLGKNSRQFSVDRQTAEIVGGSYGDSIGLINNAASKAGKKYGWFSNRKRKKDNALINEAERQQNIMTDIADEATNQRAMVNDLNYIDYNFNLSGGYDQRYMRAAKSGMKLQDKINFIKQKRTINNFINLDTKEIEWSPAIDDIESYKKGGVLEVDQWEPIIDDAIDYWEPVIDDIEMYREGGKTKEQLDTPEIEKTSQKNLIPEGALHKNKHHMEHTEGLTQKGIPVIDNEGEQQAEIELDEIIFTLEVTKKLEELYKENTDESAIEAGKLLVNEILFNTDDRTGLIAKCEKGGKL